MLFQVAEKLAAEEVCRTYALPHPMGQKDLLLHREGGHIRKANACCLGEEGSNLCAQNGKLQMQILFKRHTDACQKSV